MAATHAKLLGGDPGGMLGRGIAPAACQSSTVPQASPVRGAATMALRMGVGGLSWARQRVPPKRQVGAMLDQ